jgi:hypothetical protein
LALPWVVNASELITNAGLRRPANIGLCSTKSRPTIAKGLKSVKQDSDIVLLNQKLAKFGGRGKGG